MTECRTCKLISLLLGKKLILPLLGKHYPLCRLAEVQKDMRGLDLKIVGGLVRRGWTTNDVDVVGKQADVPILASRLKEDHILEPVHFCGDPAHHSHLKCAYYGIKMTLTGRGY